MMQFTMSNFRVSVDPKSLMIEELREIWEGDNTQEKYYATDILSYIHLASQIDPDAPFHDARADEVGELAAKNIWGDKWKSKMDLSGFDKYIEAYLDAFEKPENRAVRTFNRKLDQFNDMLEETVPEIKESRNGKTGTFTYVTNTKAITQVMKEIRNMRIAKEELEESIKQSRQKEQKIWGQKRQSYMEKKRIQDSERRERKKNEKQNEEQKKSASVQEPKQEVHEEVGQAPVDF